MKFNKGDHVAIENLDDTSIGEVDIIGQTGVVTNVFESYDLPYRVTLDEIPDTWYFTDKNLVNLTNPIKR